MMQRKEAFKVIPETQVYVSVSDAMHAISTMTNVFIPTEHETKDPVPNGQFIIHL